MQRLIVVSIILFICLFFSLGQCYAMDPQLWNMPKPEGSLVVWQDRPVELNNIKASVTHLRTELVASRVIDYYHKYFKDNEWVIKDNFDDQHIISYSKNKKYMYVAVQDNGPGILADVFLVSSPADLSVCRIIAGYMKENIMQQDAQGKDAPDIPRYPNSKRMLSLYAYTNGMILIYQAQESPSEIAKFFKYHLKKNAWQLIQDFNSSLIVRLLKGKELDFECLVFEKGDDFLTINISPLFEEKKAKFSVITITKNVEDEFGQNIEENIEEK